MEKENVIEVEFKELWDNNFAWRISYQNEDILKIEEFEDTDLNVYSRSNYDYIKDFDTLYIKGRETNYYCSCGVYKSCTLEEKKSIEDKIKKINEKYGVKKRWRADRDRRYYFLDDEFIVRGSIEENISLDDNIYKLGNYFRTTEQAEKYVEKIKNILKENI